MELTIISFDHNDSFTDYDMCKCYNIYYRYASFLSLIREQDFSIIKVIGIGKYL